MTIQPFRSILIIYSWFSSVRWQRNFGIRINVNFSFFRVIIEKWGGRGWGGSVRELVWLFFIFYCKIKKSDQIMGKCWYVLEYFLYDWPWLGQDYTMYVFYQHCEKWSHGEEHVPVLICLLRAVDVKITQQYCKLPKSKYLKYFWQIWQNVR